MIVTVPFAYSVDVVPKGKRKPIDMTLMSSVVVDVPIVPADEAPVVLRWHRPGDAGSEDGNPAVEYRRVGVDAFFVPVFDTHAREPDRQIGLDEMIENAGDGRCHRANPLFAGEDFSYHKANGVEADFPGAAFSNSKEEEVAAEIRVKAADLMSVDGMIFRRAMDAEPVYELHPFGWYDRAAGEQRQSCYVKTRRIGSIPAAERDVRKHFRVDQLSEVLGAAEAEGADIAGWDPDRPETFRRAIQEPVEVLDPTALAYRPDQGPQLLAFAQGQVSRDKDEIGDAPREQMMAYADLRDALKAGLAADGICGLLEAYAASMRPRSGNDEFWTRVVADRQADIAEEVATFRLAPLPEPAPPAVQGPRP
jgi:hypothetical protein